MSDIELFLEALASGSDVAVEEIIENFHKLSTPQAASVLNALLPLLKSPDPNIRWWAVRGLAALDDSRVVELLLSALDDPEPMVRQCAALGLRLHPQTNAVSALINSLQDEDYLTVNLAADALVVIGEASVLPLIDVLQQGRRTARPAAARALAQIGDHRAIPVLFSVLEDDSALVEHWAAEGLERMGVGMTFFRP
jgi:HEAT repeat protein